MLLPAEFDQDPLCQKLSFFLLHSFLPEDPAHSVPSSFAAHQVPFQTFVPQQFLFEWSFLLPQSQKQNPLQLALEKQFQSLLSLPLAKIHFPVSFDLLPLQFPALEVSEYDFEFLLPAVINGQKQYPPASVEMIPAVPALLPLLVK